MTRTQRGTTISRASKSKGRREGEERREGGMEKGMREGGRGKQGEGRN